jgi:hypothetical protein
MNELAGISDHFVVFVRKGGTFYPQNRQCLMPEHFIKIELPDHSTWSVAHLSAVQ